MLARDLERSLHRALALANERRHESATLEHLLLALTEDRNAIALLDACNVDLDRMRRDVLGYIDKKLANLVSNHTEEAKPTASFQRVLQRAAVNVQSSGVRQVTGADLLIAMFAERDSYAIQFLSAHKVNQLDALKHLSPAVLKRATPTQADEAEVSDDGAQEAPKHTKTSSGDDTDDNDESFVGDFPAYHFIGSSFLFLSASIVLAYYLSNWWLILSLLALVGCMQYALVLREATLTRPRDALGLLGFVLSKPFYLLVITLQDLRAKRILRYSGRWNHSPESLISGIQREARHHLIRNRPLRTTDISAASSRFWQSGSIQFRIGAFLILNMGSLAYVVYVYLMRKDPPIWFFRNSTDRLPPLYLDDRAENEDHPHKDGDDNADATSTAELLALVRDAQYPRAFHYVLEVLDRLELRGPEGRFLFFSDQLRDEAVRRMRFWVGCSLWLIKNEYRPSMLELRRLYNHIVRYKAIEIDILQDRNRVIVNAPRARRVVFKEIYPSLEERVDAEVRRGKGNAPDVSLRAFRLQMRRYIAQFILGQATPPRTRAIGAVDGQKYYIHPPPSRTALLDFFKYSAMDRDGPDRYAAFIIVDRECTCVDLGEASRLETLIAAHVREISGDQLSPVRRAIGTLSDATAARSGRTSGGKSLELSSALFAPLSSFLVSVDSLVICPDGMISSVPFETLPFTTGTLVIDRFIVSYVDSAREMGRWTERPHAESTVPCIVGAPDFGLGWSEDGDRGGFSSLANTEAEANAIGDILSVRPLLGADANETAIKSLNSPKVLHIATHGFFFRSGDAAIGGELERLSALERLEEPLARSGLALAGANAWLKGRLIGAEDDGLLTAEDVLEMNLQGTELVVLSACDTGLGEVRSGEGVFGIRRTLTIAGAQTVIMSLWKVPDKQTRLLMEMLYRNLVKGYGRAEALRLAQLELRQEYPDPRDWAAFVCLGDVGPLTITDPSTSA